MITRREILQVGAATAALTLGGGFTRANFTRALAQQRLTKPSCCNSMRSAMSRCCTSPTFTANWCRSISASPRSISGWGRRADSRRISRVRISSNTSASRRNRPRPMRSPRRISRRWRRPMAASAGSIASRPWSRRVRAERGDKVLFLDGGDTWQGSLGANASKGQDMVDCMALLKPDAMTGHWEFTYGEARVKELIKGLGFPFLALNVRDTEWEEPVFPPMKMFERGGVKIAVLGQAFPYTPVANPRWLMPKWSFGIREEDVRANVEKARKSGAQLVVLLSHNGFDVDRKLAASRTGHRRDPHRAYARCAARGNQSRQHAADRVGQPRQILVPVGYRRAEQRGDGLPLQTDPALCRRHCARCRDDRGHRQSARALRQGPGARGGARPVRCSTGAAISTAPSTT